ncbi:MAG: tRNA adenosine(34) deaminase TadA, partial [Candidatus Aminicenantales bacterium]
MKAIHDDAYFMEKALAEARNAGERGEVPIGAVIVRDGRIVARGSNRPISADDPTAHAEIVALRKAAGKMKNYRLNGCTLYVTLEPCAMCLGAVVQARIERLVFGASDPKSGAVSSVMRFPFRKLNHRPAIRGGILAEDGARLLSEFFKR